MAAGGRAGGGLPEVLLPETISPACRACGHVREPAAPDDINHSIALLPPQPAAASEIPFLISEA
jgi:hypothetical protein